MNKIITINEVADKLRVSKHSVQAWISPSSPNHRPEFAAMVRHAGRKSVFLEEEIDLWLNQRKGAMYSQKFVETSAYWRERFASARGLFKGKIKEPELGKNPKRNFSSGKLALDYEPLLLWLTDSASSKEIQSYISKAESLVIAIPLVWWFLKRVWRNSKQLAASKKFLIEDNIFELAPMNEESLKNSLGLPTGAGEISIQSYACCITAGATSLLTANSSLLRTPGLCVCSI